MAYWESASFEKEKKETFPSRGRIYKVKDLWKGDFRLSTNKVLSALCYFSVFFAPFILPIVVYFVVEDVEVKRHAKRSLVSHLIPAATILLFIALAASPVLFGHWGEESLFVGGGLAWLGFLVAGVVNLVVVIWNVIKGIQVLK